jgi:hypothetical protein
MITRDRQAPSIGRQVRTFVAIGIASTLAYAALYALLRPLAPAAIANGLALVATALGNTTANRHFTFGVRWRDALIRDHAAGHTSQPVNSAMSSSGVAVGSAVPAGPARPPAISMPGSLRSGPSWTTVAAAERCTTCRR